MCPFESRKCEKERKNYKNLSILTIKRAFLDTVVFEGPSFGLKKI